MKSNLLIAMIICTLLLLGAGELPIAVAAGFDDPNIEALHEYVDSMRVKAEKGDPEAQ